MRATCGIQTEAETGGSYTGDDGKEKETILIRKKKMEERYWCKNLVIKRKNQVTIRKREEKDAKSVYKPV